MTILKSFHDSLFGAIENNSIPEEVEIITETQTGNFSLYTVKNKNGITFHNVPGARGFSDRGFLSYIQRDTTRPVMISGSAKVTTSISTATSVSWPVADITEPLPEQPVLLQDANNWSSFPDFNTNGAILNLRRQSAPAPPEITRIFMKFSIDTDWTSIVTATLTMESLSGIVPDENFSFDVVRVTVPSWTESGVTWNEYASGNAWTVAGGDFTTTDKTTEIKLLSNPATTQIFDITALAQDAIANRSFVLDIMFKSTIEEAGNVGDLRYAGREHPSVNGPILTLT